MHAETQTHTHTQKHTRVQKHTQKLAPAETHTCAETLKRTQQHTQAHARAETQKHTHTDLTHSKCKHRYRAHSHAPSSANKTDLHDVVFRDRANDPGFVRVP